MTLRDAIVENALWGVDNEPQIHYRQSRPIDGLDQPRKLPLYTDCSGFVTDCYKWAGAPDPNGLNYSGQGFTGTLLDHLEHIGPAEIEPGDLVVFGSHPGEHVVIVAAAGMNPMVVSHGQERGPIKVRLSVEAAAHQSPMTFLRGAGLDDEEDDMTDDDRKLVQAAIDAANNAATIASDVRNLIKDPTVGILHRLDSLENKVDAPVDELRRNVRRVGTAVKAVGIEGKA